jgi:hypothetical protein
MAARRHRPEVSAHWQHGAESPIGETGHDPQRPEDGVGQCERKTSECRPIQVSEVVVVMVAIPDVLMSAGRKPTRLQRADPIHVPRVSAGSLCPAFVCEAAPSEAIGLQSRTFGPSTSWRTDRGATDPDLQGMQWHQRWSAPDTVVMCRTRQS